MIAEAAGAASADPGLQLRRLRRARQLSQLSLSLSAGVSARHLSFVETGRARPGRDVLLKLAGALGLTELEQSGLLARAGFAPVAPPSGAADTDLAVLGRSVRAVLSSLDPHPSVLVDTRWDILMPNAAYLRLQQLLLGRALCPRGAFQFTETPRPNRVRELARPEARPFILNWTALASSLRSRLEAEALLSGDPALDALLGESAAWGLPAGRTPGAPGFPLRVELSLQGVVVSLFSLVTGWATQMPGLRIETLHPSDEHSERALRALLGPLPSPPRGR